MKAITAIRHRISNAHPDHRAIFRGLVWVALFVFLGKLAGAFKEMAVAYRYGVSDEVDAYLFIYNIVAWPAGIWFSVLTYVLVPLLVRVKQEQPRELPQFRAELLAFTFMLGCALVILFWFGLPALLRTSWAGLSPATLQIALNIMPEMVMLAPLNILASLFSAWMLASGRHQNTLLESVPALTIIAALFLLPGNGVLPLVWGTAVGFILHVASLGIPLSNKGEVEMPRFTLKSTQWPVFWQGFGVLLAGNFLMSFMVIIDQFFAAHAGAGVIATLSYANRILTLITSLGATAVSRATLPIFSKAQAHETEQSQQIAMQWVRIMFVLGLVAMVICWWLAPWAVKILFERGAFTLKDTATVAEVFRYGIIQFPFYFAALVMVTLLASRQHHKLIAINASINLFVKIAANYLLVPNLGANGIILATAVTYMVSFMVLYWCSLKSLKLLSKRV